MKSVKVRDKEFELFIPESEIIQAIDRIAEQMNTELEGKDPLFVCILNGSFMFAAELMKKVTIPSEISFVRMASYQGTKSTGKIKEIYGLEEDIAGRTIVIIEDIVDTGHTMSLILDQLACDEPKEIKVATLLFKPEALKTEVKLDYVALEIPSDFIVGFGLDYDGYGRNLADIYKIKS
ncbi:hypoxanthine phosphoribosyltransferase [Dysgonomonas macrotermitis]|uniref:Hypoxanthine phosphoribosyltransferase n=1 Tax=Dysgonomonas macrotermitis TaxID=1346286 RepID=A0A1M5FAS0_9BACT|nr:hypoxanthine phosphoribosyltransferase [Dysgonomonas macrotermitis]SHF88710.1 hypoxanthine phosphoribosyltransferase [Dysgonomonas macrotermitis]